MQLDEKILAEISPRFKETDDITEYNQLKMLSVTAIFLIHCKFPGWAGEIIRGVASFGVPVFFMIAGFYSYRISRSKIRKRAGHLFQLIVGANLFYLVWDLAYLCLTGENVAVWTAENLNWKKLLIFLLFQARLCTYLRRQNALFTNIYVIYSEITL